MPFHKSSFSMVFKLYSIYVTLVLQKNDFYIKRLSCPSGATTEELIHPGRKKSPFSGVIEFL